MLKNQFGKWGTINKCQKEDFVLYSVWLNLKQELIQIEFQLKYNKFLSSSVKSVIVEKSHKILVLFPSAALTNILP